MKKVKEIVKKGRGRPHSVDPTWVKTTADNHRSVLTGKWHELGPKLLAARTERDVMTAIQESAWDSFISVQLVPVILRVLREPTFPKRTAAQIKFLADSIAGGVKVTPRRSRDICAEQRKPKMQTYKIISYGISIECGCGYEGLSVNNLCPQCGAVLDLSHLISK